MVVVGVIDGVPSTTHLQDGLNHGEDSIENDEGICLLGVRMIRQMLKDLCTTQPNVLVTSIDKMLHCGHNVLRDHDGAIVGLFRGSQNRFCTVVIDFVVRGIVNQSVDCFNTTYQRG